MTKTIPLTLKRTQRDYTLGFKLSLVERIEKGEMTYKQAQHLYGIQGRSTVLVWLRKHGKLAWNFPGENAMTVETPAQTIKRLQRELEDARLKISVVEEMMTVIDKEHGGNLKKKYLSRLSETGKPKDK